MIAEELERLPPRFSFFTLGLVCKAIVRLAEEFVAEVLQARESVAQNLVDRRDRLLVVSAGGSCHSMDMRETAPAVGGIAVADIFVVLQDVEQHQRGVARCLLLDLAQKAEPIRLEDTRESVASGDVPPQLLKPAAQGRCGRIEGSQDIGDDRAEDRRQLPLWPTLADQGEVTRAEAARSDIPENDARLAMGFVKEPEEVALDRFLAGTTNRAFSSSQQVTDLAGGVCCRSMSVHRCYHRTTKTLHGAWRTTLSAVVPRKTPPDPGATAVPDHQPIERAALRFLDEQLGRMPHTSHRVQFHPEFRCLLLRCLLQGAQLLFDDATLFVDLRDGCRSPLRNLDDGEAP